MGPPVLLVKKDVTLRLCMDYKEISKITIKTQCPLPLREDLFDQLRGEKTFSNIDLWSGCHQFHIKEEGIPKMALCTWCGHYEYVTMPFRFTNSPVAFMDLINRVFKPYLDKFMVLFIDDILVYLRTPEEHAYHLQEVLEVLRKHTLNAKLKKCEFWLEKVAFLGQVVSNKGISVYP